MHSEVSQVRLALGLLTAGAWCYLVYMAWGMAHMESVADSLIMPAMMHWQVMDLVLVFIMWSIMMAAMMLPSAMPMVQMFARNARTQQGTSTGAFVAGYLAIWTLFSAAATLAQWGLLELRLITPMMESASRWLSGGLLVCAGLFQFTGLKQSCLNKCRTPLGFILTEWRPGTQGAFVMGVRHGTYCAGCCAMLMLLLFVLGVMNLAWILVLTLLVLTEKLLWTDSHLPSRIVGVGFILWGGYLWIVMQI